MDKGLKATRMPFLPKIFEILFEIPATQGIEMKGEGSEEEGGGLEKERKKDLAEWKVEDIFLSE